MFMSDIAALCAVQMECVVILCHHASCLPLGNCVSPFLYLHCHVCVCVGGISREVIAFVTASLFLQVSLQILATVSGFIFSDHFYSIFEDN